MRSLLLVGDVRLHQLRISLKCAPCVRREEGPYEIEQVALRLAVLEQNQKRYAQKRHDELHEDIERHAENARCVAHEVREKIHQSRECEHENQVLKFKTQERYSRMEIAVYRCEIKTHHALSYAVRLRDHRFSEAHNARDHQATHRSNDLL